MSKIQNLIHTLTDFVDDVADALQDTELMNDDKR